MKMMILNKLWYNKVQQSVSFFIQSIEKNDTEGIDTFIEIGFGVCCMGLLRKFQKTVLYFLVLIMTVYKRQ